MKLRALAFWSIGISLAGLNLAPAWPADPAPDFTLEAKGAELILLPPPAHHFNKDAPVKILFGEQPLKPVISEAKITAKLPAGKAGTVNATAFLCDDAKTYCVRKQASLAVAPSTGTPGEPAREKPKARQKASARVKSYYSRETGFWMNAPEQAFAEARQKKLPLLIDFFGIWCPPCNHLEATVWKSKTFQARTNGKIVRLMLDADQESVAEIRKLKDKHRISALPTTVFTTSGGDEIFRVLGYRPEEDFVRRVELAHRNRDKGYEQLVAEGRQENAESAYQAALIELDRGEAAQALARLAPMKAMWKEAGDARLETVLRAELESAEAPEAREKVLREWLAAFPSSASAIENLERLADILGEKGDESGAKEALTRLLAALDRYPSLPEAERLKTDFSPSDLQQYRAGALKQLGRADEAKAAYLECARILATPSRAAAEKGFARGPSLERAYCLAKGGKLPESEALYREGVRRFPGEYTFHAGLAAFLLDERNDPAAAAAQGGKALRAAYGSQRLKAAGLLSRIHEKAGNLLQAIEILDREMAAAAEEDSSEGRKRGLERLRKRKGVLEKRLANPA